MLGCGAPGHTWIHYRQRICQSRPPFREPFYPAIYGRAPAAGRRVCHCQIESGSRERRPGLGSCGCFHRTLALVLGGSFATEENRFCDRRFPTFLERNGRAFSRGLHDSNLERHDQWFVVRSFGKARVLLRFHWVAGGTLALLVIGKVGVAAFSWSRIHSCRARQYLLLWIGATLCLVTLAVVSRPAFDTDRQRPLYLLVALLLFPFARRGAAPICFEKNRAA